MKALHSARAALGWDRLATDSGVFIPMTITTIVTPRWMLADHGHHLNVNDATSGAECDKCHWYLYAAERFSAFYLQNHGDCVDGKYLQQCLLAQVCLFQDGVEE